MSPYTTRLFVHQFRVATPADLDQEFAGWVREAYAVGAGAHLRRPDAPGSSAVREGGPP